MTAAVIIPTLDPQSPLLRGSFDSLVGMDCTALIEHDENRDGFAATCNKGAKRAIDADILIFLNDDTIPQPGWLDPLLRASLRDGIAGNRLVYPDGRIQHTGVFLRRDPDGTLTAYNRHTEARSGPVPAVTGACLAIRRDIFDDLAGFDEGFVNGYEDVDLCLRARQAGHEISYVAESTVIHLESQSDPQLRFGHARENIALLQQRWGHLPI